MVNIKKTTFTGKEKYWVTDYQEIQTVLELLEGVREDWLDNQHNKTLSLCRIPADIGIWYVQYFK